MNEKTRNILTRPFPKELIKLRQGPGGKQLEYIEVQHVIDRLNEAFGHEWSYEITCREQFEDQVIVEVRLSAGAVVKTGLGGSSLRRSKDTGKLLSLADDFKMAEASALKRAARSLGVAAELYRDEDEPRQDDHYSAQPEPAPPLISDMREAGRITIAQLNKLEELVGELGSDWQSFRRWVREQRGTNVEYASRRAGSELIEDLIGRLRRKRGLNGSAELAREGRQE